MKKYAGKQDYTQEDLNMITGCGFDDITAQLLENAQILRRIETELKQLRNMTYTLDQIRSASQDIDKTTMNALKETLRNQHDLINAQIAQGEKNADQTQINKTVLEALRTLADQITQLRKEAPEG